MPNPSGPQMELLCRVYDHDLIIVGTLGEDPRHPNHRIYRTSDGDVIMPKRPSYGYRTVNGLETLGLVRVVSTSGEDPPKLKYLVVTEAGRSVARVYRERRVGVGRG